jgi:hypothetical protein
MLEQLQAKRIDNQQAKDLIKKNYETSFNKWRDYDLLTALVAVIGLALAIVDYEYTWKTANNQVNATLI